MCVISEGAKIEGLERLRSLLFRPKIRTATLNDGEATVPLVPGTTEDGMVVSAPRWIAGTGAFEELPRLKTIQIEGVSRNELDLQPAIDGFLPSHRQCRLSHVKAQNLQSERCKEKSVLAGSAARVEHRPDESAFGHQAHDG